ncbi:MAG TPA: hypothetical protein VLK23_07825 [Thermodesulfobacteriota bacterium]|nr:hypothetical protein [Thermodesulfobacteriota bacterium]
MTRPLLLFCMFIVFACTACENKPSPSPEKSEPPSVSRVVVEGGKGDRESPLPPEVKIRLKRDGKDNYSWELSGSDVDQIIKVNEKLRKKVGSEQTK